MSAHFLNFLFNLLELFLYSPVAIPKDFRKSLSKDVLSDLKAHKFIIFNNQALNYKNFKVCLVVKNNLSRKTYYEDVFFQNYLRSIVLNFV